jgi:hypothetical protein
LRPVPACHAAAPLAAQGDLLIAPTRLVLEGGRGGEVILSNIGTEEAVYRVTLEIRRMTPDGDLSSSRESAATDSEKAVLAMVRYAPRGSRFRPGEPQAIRASARGRSRAARRRNTGAHVAHAIPRSYPVADQTEAIANGQLSIQLVPIYGVPMPIIIRKGDLHATAGLANPQLVQGERGPAFSVDINREGDESITATCWSTSRWRRSGVRRARVSESIPKSPRAIRRSRVGGAGSGSARQAVRIEFRAGRQGRRVACGAGHGPALAPDRPPLR